ncbi:MAG: CvpA family protein [Thermodesulfobacteriota bacterium]|nr:CvpA family protein [Thermodesulfobacteriota bacterium]
MNWLDIVIIIIVSISIFFGLKIGLMKSFFYLFSLVMGIFFASRYYPDGAKILSGIIHTPSLASIVSFVAIFFIIAGITTLIGIMLKRFIYFIHLGWVDRFGGGLLGLLCCCIFIGVSLLFLANYPILGSEKWIFDSVLSPFLIHFIEYLWKLIPRDLLI